MRCPSCGFENLDNARRCMSCNLVFIEETMPPPQPLQQEDLRELASYKPPFFLRLAIGEAVGQSYAIYFKHFVPFFLITAVANVPALAYTQLASRVNASGLEPATMAGLTFGGVLLSHLPPQLAAAALAFGVLQHLRRRSVSTRECVTVGLSVMIPVIVVALLQFLAVMAGTMLCLIPGIVAAVVFAVAVPAAVEEKVGPIKAMQRSLVLTRDFRWGVFGILLVLFFINFVLGVLIGITIGVSPGSLFVSQVLTMLYQIVASGIAATAGAFMYYRLRCIKESVDIDNLASVFD
jgi:hypothetical protein